MEMQAPPLTKPHSAQAVMINQSNDTPQENHHNSNMLLWNSFTALRNGTLNYFNELNNQLPHSLTSANGITLNVT